MSKFKLNFNNPKTYTGYDLTPLPKMSFTSNRACTMSEKKFNKWLLENATNYTKDDDYMSHMVSCVNIDNMSMADRDMLNIILFGSESVMIDYD